MIAAPEVIPPPESFFARVAEDDREVARGFYRKFIDIEGLPVVAAEVVNDLALQRTYEMVKQMLAGRPDVLAELGGFGMYLIIIGRDQVYTDMPENRNAPNPAYLNERVRGTGGLPTSFGEENLLSLPLDRYDDESIAVHEFGHTIDFSMRRLDPAWEPRLEAAYANAVSKGLFFSTYAGSCVEEYWAENVQNFFDCNRVNNWNHGPVGTREQFRDYDPDGYELFREVFNLGTADGWRYQWLQTLPNVTPPAARFGFPSYYTRFTYARELPVIGRGASDASLLKANHAIRRMFAYRHDILKELINRGARLVVLSAAESMADLPEAQQLVSSGADPTSRRLDFHPGTGLLVVCEDQMLTSPTLGADNPLVAVLARAIYDFVADRPVSHAVASASEVQQYELRVERIDSSFRQRIDQLFAQSRAAGALASLIREPSNYWTHGVLCYFDAAGHQTAALGVSHRAILQACDPELFDLVHATMAFAGRPDWRWNHLA